MLTVRKFISMVGSMCKAIFIWVVVLVRLQRFFFLIYRHWCTLGTTLMIIFGAARTLKAFFDMISRFMVNKVLF